MKTGLPRTNNKGAFAPEDIPAVEGETRFLLDRTYEGQSATPTQSLAFTFRELARLQVEQAERKREVKRVKLFGVAWNTKGEAILIPRGYQAGVVELELAGRKGRFKSQSLIGGQMVDELMLDPGYDAGEDKAAWEALRQMVEDAKLKNSELRTCIDAFAIVMCRKAGIITTADQLPRLGTPHN